MSSKKSSNPKEELLEKLSKVKKQLEELEKIENSTEYDELQKKQKIQEFCKENNVINTDLETKIKEWKDQKNDYENKLNEIQIIENELEELEHIQNTELLIQKLKDDISKIEKQIKKYQNDIENKEKEKNKEVKPNEKTSALDELFDSSKSQANEKNLFISMPNLPQLPQTGKLYQSDKDSYLAIEFWEEYEQGKKEAERLKAKLCAIY